MNTLATQRTPIGLLVKNTRASDLRMARRFFSVTIPWVARHPIRAHQTGVLALGLAMPTLMAVALLRILPPEYEWIIVALALGFVAVQSGGLLVAPDDRVVDRFDQAYWSATSCRRRSYHRTLIDAFWVDTALRNVGSWVSVGAVLALVAGPGAVLIELALIALGTLGLWARFAARTQGAHRTGIAAYVARTGVVAAITYGFFAAIMAVEQMSRSALAEAGFGEEFVAATDTAIREALVRAMSAVPQFLGPETLGSARAIAGTTAVTGLAVGATLLLRRPLRRVPLRVQVVGRYTGLVLDRAVRRRLPLAAAAHLRKDALSLRRRQIAWGHRDIDLVLPLEMWMAIAANAAVLPKVHNPWLVLMVVGLQAHVVAAGVCRNLASHFPTVFDFVADMVHVPLYRQVAGFAPVDVFRAKVAVLRALAGPLVVANLALIGVSCVALGAPPLPVLAGLVVAAASWIVVPEWVLAPEYDMFQAVVARTFVVDVDETVRASELAGHAQLKRGYTIGVTQTTYVLVLAIVVASMFSLVSGDGWAVFAIGGPLAMVVSVGMAVWSVRRSVAPGQEPARESGDVPSGALRRWWSERRRIVVVITLLEAAALVAGIVVSRGDTVTMSPTALSFGTILGHNLAIGGAVIALGLASFGLTGLGVAAYNLFALGTTIGSVWHSYGAGPLLTGVAPHAAVELAGLTLAAVIGAEGFVVLRRARLRALGESRALLDPLAFIAAVVVAILLFVVAAGVEAVISHV